MCFNWDMGTWIQLGLVVAGLLTLGGMFGWLMGSWRESRRTAAFIVGQCQTDSVVKLHARVKVQDQLNDDFADMLYAALQRLRTVETKLGMPEPPKLEMRERADAAFYTAE